MTKPGAGNRLQDTFLDAAYGQPLTLFLANGVRLLGTIIAADRHALLFLQDGVTLLVYKHAVSTCVPAAVIDLRTTDTAEGEPDRKG